MRNPRNILIIADRGSIWTKDFIDRVFLRCGANISLQFDPTQSSKFDGFYRENNVAFVASYRLSPLLMKIPKLRVLYHLQKNKAALKSVRGQFDQIVVIYTTPYALKCAVAVSDGKAQIYAHFIGSDILRSDNKNTRRLQKIIQKQRPFVVCESRQTERAFQEKIGEAICHKTKVIYLGDVPLLHVDAWMEKGTDFCKKQYEIPTDKLSVCIGYNASPAQQHIKVIEQLKKLDENIKNKICLLFPVAYGGSEKYIEELSLASKTSGIEFCLLRQFLNPDEVASLRVATDVFINAQTTDSISASVLENYYSGAKLINASWLQYQEFVDWDLEYKSFNSFDGINSLLIETVENFARGNKNRAIVLRECSWETCAEKWCLWLKENQK